MGSPGCGKTALLEATLDALAARGARFEAMTSASSWTLPSLATLMTGRHAATHGAIDDRHGLTDELPVLAERAAAAGYATHGIGSHIFLGERYGLQRGFATTAGAAAAFAMTHYCRWKGTLFC